LPSRHHTDHDHPEMRNHGGAMMISLMKSLGAD
jgi:hypothetical protein